MSEPVFVERANRCLAQRKPTVNGSDRCNQLRGRQMPRAALHSRGILHSFSRSFISRTIYWTLAGAGIRAVSEAG